MKRKDLEIWKVLTSNLGKSITVDAISDITKLSRREVISRIQRINSPYVSRHNSGGQMCYCLNCNMTDAIWITTGYLASYYSCTYDDIVKILRAVSPAGTVTIDTVKEVTGEDPLKIAYVLYMTPNIIVYKSGTKNQYTMTVED